MEPMELSGVSDPGAAARTTGPVTKPGYGAEGRHEDRDDQRPATETADYRGLVVLSRIEEEVVDDAR